MRKSKTTSEFIQDSIKVHGNKYDYSLVKYINCRTKVNIICPIHGEFLQKATNHISGHGCSKCNRFSDTYSHSVWENLGNKSDSFDSFKVYIVELWNDEERFYKIGKTYETVGNRFRSTTIPYNWKTVKVFEGNAKYISELEDELHMKYKEHKYVPIKKFSGSTECFNISISL